MALLKIKEYIQIENNISFCTDKSPFLGDQKLSCRSVLTYQNVMNWFN